MSEENGITIRAARGTDALAVTEILRDLGWFEKVNAEPLESLRSRIQKTIEESLNEDRHMIWVAEESNGTVVGYLAFHWNPSLKHPGPEGYLSEIFVREDRRGKGVGKKLVDTAVEEGRRRGCYRLTTNNRRMRESYIRKYFSKSGWRERPDSANFILLLND
ncbi:MAG TPA: GNAT family N-acetyltransferase [Nitrospiria bacterium]